ncbi:MAG: hypothetical protein QOD30_1608 [Actinomycetota bacterium]|nr:hypothetical protein [Actinomycetota bacterium]
MTERKPTGVSWESWIDKQIRDAMERGEFDDLPGKGKPLPDIDSPRDELWWIRQKLQRENVQFLPPALQVRKDLDDVRDRIAATDDETVVRTLVAEINEKIREVNRSVVTGPPSTLVPLDVERVVERWRGERAR